MKLLQSATGITKSGLIYYKVLQVLKSVTIINKWHVNHDLIYFFENMRELWFPNIYFCIGR